MRSRLHTRRQPAAIGAALAVALVLCGAPTAADAAPTDAISLSSNGVDFAPDLPAGLFNSLGTFIPGRTASVRIWVRNDSPAEARLRVDAWAEASTDPEYTASLTISATVPDAPGRAAALGSQPSCTALVTDRILDSGSAVPITFRLSMSDVAGTTAQAASADAMLRFTLTDAAAPAPEDCPPGGTTVPVVGGPGAAPASGPSMDDLAQTGLDFQVSLAAATALVIGGLAALLRRRRRQS